MPSTKKLPECDKLKELVEVDDRSNNAIAEMYGVTPEAVRQALVRCGIDRPRQRLDHSHYFPWKGVRSNHQRNVLAGRLRSYSKLMQDKPLRDNEKRLLDEFREWMDGENEWGVPFSVHYNRDDPDGFWVEPRKPGDRDYISPP